MFSPYYARARRRGAARADHYNALNVALYGADAKRWSMTERGASALRRDADELRIGPSGLRWDGACLVIDIAEVGVPIPSRIRGQVRLYPPATSPAVFALDAGGHHCWRPIAPRARVEVEMQSPRASWHGDAYWDSNWGDEGLEARFERWDWSRAMLADGRCAILYHAQLRAEPVRAFGLCFDAGAACTHFTPPPDHALPATAIWRIDRATQCEPDSPPDVIRTLEDTPFYARSVVRSKLLGERVEGIHESLSLTRFRQPWVHLLLPFRMPRRAG